MEIALAPVLEWAVLGASAIAAAFWAAAYASPVRRRNLFYRIEADDELPEPPVEPVAVICPGRDEARQLPETLARLARQDHPDYVVFFVDDASGDDTPAVARRIASRHAHLHVVRVESPPPAGWVGKCWAIEHGRAALVAHERAAGRRYALIAFTDADVSWHPACLRQAVSALRSGDADVLGILPHVRLETPAERLVVPMLALAVGLAAPFERVMDPQRKEALLAGGFILADREAYERIGGHAAVAGRILEDIGLAHAFKAAGARLRIGATRELVTGRMYEGWRDLREGLAKNAYAGVGYRPAALFGLSLLVLAANVAPPLYVVGGLAGYLAASWPLGPAIAALGGIAAACQARVMNAVRREMDLPLAYAFAVPAGSALYLGILAVSAWQHHRGGNVWKGRRYGQEAA